MSTEFIAAKDLPVAEGDEVDVLCVENGELKRKEGASLGDKYDLVLETASYLSTGVDYSPEDITVVSGSVSSCIEKMLVGEIPAVKIKALYQYYYDYTFSQSLVCGVFLGSNVFTVRGIIVNGDNTGFLNIEISFDRETEEITGVHVSSL